MYVYLVVEIFLVGIILVLLFFMVSFKKQQEFETLSSYECGFSVNTSTRVCFSYRFFLIALLFLVFDVEIALMLVTPLVGTVSPGSQVFVGFIVILVLGLVYEFSLGSLDWVGIVSKA